MDKKLISEYVDVVTGAVRERLSPLGNSEDIRGREMHAESLWGYMTREERIVARRKLAFAGLKSH